jgi:protein-L-isoaspartate(D-aspartate) O-methyltransferase
MEQLVNELIARRALKTRSIISAFRRTDRQKFVHPETAAEAYGDYPLPIGFGQTISQPYTVAFMLELLAPRPGEKILDVGSGSGWTTALLAHLVGEKGRVFGVEIVPELVAFGQENLKKCKLPQAEVRPAGKTFGLPEEAPFDRILVSAASSKTVPPELLAQLKTGGTMVIPLGNSIMRLRKTAAGKTEVEEFPGFVFVPLVSGEKTNFGSRLEL